MKYKGIAESMRIVNRCLDGGYVNFGVFALYGDRALDSAFDTVFQLALSIQPAELAVSKHMARVFHAAVFTCQALVVLCFMYWWTCLIAAAASCLIIGHIPTHTHSPALSLSSLSLSLSACSPSRSFPSSS